MWIDLTMPLNEYLPAWPETDKCSISSHCQSNCTSSTLYLPLHFGTHIDAPKHFIPEGKTINEFNINDLCGITQIIDTGQSEYINADHVKNISCPFVFFKTKNIITPEFNSDYCYISPEAAHVLLAKKVKLVGIDYLSVENFYDNNFTVHKLLLKNDVLLVEGLNLQSICEGKYQIMVIPLNIPAEASPVRVLAFTSNFCK